MKNRLFEKLILTEFIIMIIIPIINFNFEKNKSSVAENKTYASFPSFIDNEKINLAFPDEFVSWFEDNLGFRENAIVSRRRFISNFYKQSSNSFVEKGKQDWLFYTLDDNIKIAEGRYPNFEDEKIIEITNTLDDINEDLKNKNISFIFIIPPSKVSIYPEFIQSSNCFISETPSDRLIGFINKNTEIKTIDLKNNLLKYKEKYDLYYKKDTHWNQIGRYIGYLEIIKKFNELGLISNEPIECNWKIGKHAGDLSRLISDGIEEECYIYEVIDGGVEISNNNDEFISFLNNYGIASGNVYTNKKENERRVLIFGDSMINNIAPLLAENFHELYFVRSYDINEDIIDYVNPDLVVLDVSERYLNTMQEHINSYYNNNGD